MEISTKKRAMIFSGTSNPELAHEIADHLGMRLGRMELNRFASGDVYARSLESVRGADCFVIQSHCHPVNEMIMEQLVMIDALKRASAKRVNAVIPFYGYSRQDRKALAREPISARLVANLLQVAGADRVLSVDLHTGQIQGFFDVPVDHLTALPILAEYVGRTAPDDLVVVAPDAGGVHLAEKFAHHLRAPVAFMQKRRRPDLRNVSETFDLVGDVEGKRCLIVDDMIDTGGTVANAVTLLLTRGATSVTVAASHGVFSRNALERLAASGLEELIVTNSIPIPKERHIPQLTVLSIAPIVAATIKAVFEDESVSQIFQGENQEYIPPDSPPRPLD
ncbi:MAG: ribose-phosphate diphosphokinase [Actinomycetota bacterium]